MVKVPFYKPMFTWRTQGSQFLLYKTLEAPKNISQHHSYEAPMWTIPFLLFSTWRMPWLHRTSKPTRGLFVPNHLKTWIIFPSRVWTPKDLWNYHLAERFRSTKVCKKFPDSISNINFASGTAGLSCELGEDLRANHFWMLETKLPPR